jgi:glycosyltransferase involved in cell wall biosynthesis
MKSNSITILFVLRDPLPPKRPDVLTLFGKELTTLNIRSLFIGQFARGKETKTLCGGNLYALGHYGGGISTLLIPFFDLYSAFRAYRAHSVDCIQVRDKISSAVIFCFVAKLLRLPFVYWMSFPFVEGHEEQAMIVGRRKGALIRFAYHFRAALARWTFYRIVLPKADHIFVQSDAMRAWLASKGVEFERMTAVPMGVDVALFNRSQIPPTDDSRLNGRRVITYVGALGKARNSIFLLELVTALKLVEPKIILMLVGDARSPDEQQWIRDEILNRGLEDFVLLTGWLSHEQVGSYAVRAEVGLSPIPRGELFDVSSPTKLIEYLALGIPSVANDIPDQKLVIERSLAGICVPMEVGAFGDAVLRLLNDDNFRQQCASHGPLFARAERSYDVMAQRVASRYREILAQYKC